MDNVTDARMRWLESSLDLVRTAFTHGATAEHRKAAATVLRAAASMLDDTPAANPATTSAQATTSELAHPIEQFLAALVAKLDEREDEQQRQRNGIVGTPHVGYGPPWPWAWPSWR